MKEGIAQCHVPATFATDLFMIGFLYVAAQSGLYHHPLRELGARGSIIVGTQDLVSRGSAEPCGPRRLPTGLSRHREFPRFTQFNAGSYEPAQPISRIIASWLTLNRSGSRGTMLRRECGRQWMSQKVRYRPVYDRRLQITLQARLSLHPRRGCRGLVVGLFFRHRLVSRPSAAF